MQGQQNKVNQSMATVESVCELQNVKDGADCTALPWSVRSRADCTALPWGNGLYCKLKLKREEEELTTRSKYLNKYGGRQ